MPLRSCSQSGCSHPAVRNSGSCMICGKHLCIEHTTSKFHKCPRENDDADAFFDAYDAAKAKHQQRLLAHVDLNALRKRASQLRKGIKCSLPALNNGHLNHDVLTSQMGGQNIHVDVQFEDGVTWIARIRLDDPLLAPSHVRDYVSRSEVATMKFLEKTKIPAPKVHHFTLTTSLDDVRVPYILMDKLKGHALDWNSANSSQKTKVLKQLADIFIELKKHPLEQSGSLLLDDNGRVHVSSYAQHQLFKDPRHGIGPFHSTNAAAHEIIEFYQQMYSTGEMADFPIDSYLAFKYRLSIASSIYKSGSHQRFYLKHFDDKGDHILVDHEYNVTGIIDWEFASAEPEDLAFSSPCMIWPVAEYYDGKNQLSSDEKAFARILKGKGQDKLSSLVEEGRVHQRFWFFLGGGTPYSHDEFKALFNGLRKAVKEKQHSHERLEDYQDWRKTMLAKEKGNDARLQNILQR